MPNPSLVILTIDNCKAAHTDMALTGRTICPVCGETLTPPATLVQTEAGPQYAWVEMLNVPVRDGGKGTQMAFGL
jgi:hypothetical protein